MNALPLLDVRALSAAFRTSSGQRDVLHAISFAVARGEITGIVGESGSGKSVTAKLILRLLRKSECIITGGQILFDGDDLALFDARAMRETRGKRIAYVPQEPMNALNPSMRVGAQLELVLREHLGSRGREARRRSAAVLTQLQIDDPERILNAYPFQLSGGLRQRVVLANAFLCQPELLIADEPTTALDVTVQAEVLDLLRERARESGTAVVFITHNMGVVWRLCDTVHVMRNGEIVENGATRAVLGKPNHAYTRALLSALPERNEPRRTIASLLA